MCGRFAIKHPRALRAEFDLDAMPELEPRYNIAPTQDIPIIRADPGGRHLTLARWGLVPAWTQPDERPHATINARAETVDTKPSFRDPFRARRCIIPADGFYEWLSAGRAKLPHHIGRPDGAPFGMAGLWDLWQGPEGEVLSCAVIVTDANALVARLHHRMPVILKREDYARWLDPANHDTASLKALLVPAPDDLLTAQPVSRALNDPKNEGPEYVAGLEEPAS